MHLLLDAVLSALLNSVFASYFNFLAVAREETLVIDVVALQISVEVELLLILDLDWSPVLFPSLIHFHH